MDVRDLERLDARLQEFLAQHRWNEDLLRRRLLHIVRDEHLNANSVGVIDETSEAPAS